MESIAGATRFNHQHHHKRTPSADRFLPIFQSPPSTASTSAAASFELTEDDIFTSPPLPTPAPNPPQNPNPHTPTRTHQSGILAALPGSTTRFNTRPHLHTRPVFNHKASISSSPANPTPVVTIPRRPRPMAQPYNQSAPVNVPMLPRRREFNFDEDVVNDVEEESEQNGVFLPPHEIVASRHSPILSSSVLEGAGRTLKGRDLRQVRNAVWRKTGFLD